MFKGSGQLYTCVAILKVQVGGALGLWLGLGVLQVYVSYVSTLCYSGNLTGPSGSARSCGQDSFILWEMSNLWKCQVYSFVLDLKCDFL